MTDDLAFATDATGRANLPTAVAAWRDVVARYARHGIRLERPVALVIEDMPIMGATESTEDGHRLHVAAHAVDSGMLDGLLAHEMGHMVRTEQGHPSHRPEVHRRALEGIDVPRSDRGRGFGSVVRAVINHVQDIYADDLAIDVIGRDEDMAAFFSDWVRNSARPGTSRWQTIGNVVSVAFALGNLARHGITPADGAEARAQRFAEEEGLNLLPRFVAGFRGLPTTDETRPVEDAVREILSNVAHQVSGR